MTGDAPNPIRCAACDEVFDCGSERGSCWCNDLPPLPGSALDPATGCLCPRCFRRCLAKTARASASQAPGDVT